jgi:hypothetical protein
MSTQNPSLILVELLETDFSEGTIVEYLPGHRTDIEHGRATINKLRFEDNKLIFDTKNPINGGARLLSDLSLIHEIKKQKGIFYLDIPLLSIYAIAPDGVEIRTVPTTDHYRKRNFN